MVLISRVYRRAQHLWAAVIIIFIFLAAAGHAERAHKRKDQSAQNCRKCHRTIYREWAESAHSQASTNPDFLLLTKAPGLSRCQHCHVPGPVLLGKEELPNLRQIFPQEGVNCLSCHFKPAQTSDGNKVKGTISSLADLSNGGVDPQICGRCHQRIFTEMQAAASGSALLSSYFSCIKCHMPTVEGRLHSRLAFLPFVAKGRHYSHDFKLPLMDSAPNLIEIWATAENPSTGTLKVKTKIRNFLPHSLPGNEYGYGKIVTRVELRDNSGELVGEEEVSFHRALNSQIAPLGMKDVESHFKHLNAEPTNVEVFLYYEKGFAKPERVLLSKRRFPLLLRHKPD